MQKKQWGQKTWNREKQEKKKTEHYLTTASMSRQGKIS